MKREMTETSDGNTCRSSSTRSDFKQSMHWFVMENFPCNERSKNQMTDYDEFLPFYDTMIVENTQISILLQWICKTFLSILSSQFCCSYSLLHTNQSHNYITRFYTVTTGRLACLFISYEMETCQLAQIRPLSSTMKLDPQFHSAAKLKKYCLPKIVYQPYLH